MLIKIILKNFKILSIIYYHKEFEMDKDDKILTRK